MAHVEKKCSRCERLVKGFAFTGGTSGYYEYSQAWAKYFNAGESVLCDACMWADERYLADYPHMRQSPAVRG